jgi:hypothetical protein
MTILNSIGNASSGSRDRWHAGKSADTLRTEISNLQQEAADVEARGESQQITSTHGRLTDGFST